MTTIKLPGYKSDFGLDDPILPGGHFTWREFLWSNTGGLQIPRSKSIVDNLLVSARMMEDIREKLGDEPITVTSGYRTPELNQRVGGSRNSYHTRGEAIDFVHSTLSPRQVQYRLRNHEGGLGSYSTFTHADHRGHKARWKG